jgi:hypothetical protein
MSKDKLATSSDLAVAGFFGSFDLINLADKASKINKAAPPSLVSQENTSDVVTQFPSHRQTVIPSDNMAQDASDDQSQGTSDDQSQKASLGNNVIPSDHLSEDTSLRHIVTTSDKPTKSRISQGVTEGQKPVLQWLVKVCGNETKIVTYKMLHESLLITERAARTHIEALHKKGYIFATMATRPNSRQPIGKTISIKPTAHLALALSQSSQSSDGMTTDTSDRHYVIPSDRLSHNTAVRHIDTSADSQTYCSSSILTTTASKEEQLSFPEVEVFNRLILDEWEGWELRPKSIVEHLNKDVPLLQALLDKTAYVIRQKEGTEFAIQSKIGFLKKCLQNEFCEVDNNFISRQERVVRQRTEQMKREAARLKAAKEEERETAIELLSLQLSEAELKTIREQAIEQIRHEMKKPNMMPSDAVIESYEKNILIALAAERGLFSTSGMD